MNLLVLVEGEVGEKKVYETWIPFVNPKLQVVSDLFDIERDQFAVIAGYGYPHYFDVIDRAILDVNSVKNIDRIIIAIDSEDLSLEEKYQEVDQFVSERPCIANVFIVVQHFCLETWALGNKRLGPRNPRSELLRKFKRIYNVFGNDPELIPPDVDDDLTRAQFAEKYLRAMLNDRNKNLSYSKRNPKALLHPSYFREVKDRLLSFNHIRSFSRFLDAFSPRGD